MTEERDPPMFFDAVSVLMPVRNGQWSLGKAISDLTTGLAEHDEVLIIDDGSQDATPSLLAEWEREDPRLRVLRTPGLGLVEALNLGLREAAYEWIARADADDRYPADRLILQRAAIASDVALVTGDYRLCPSDGEDTYLPCALGHPFVALSLINPQRVPHPGVLYRRDAVLEAGGYQAKDFPAEDLGLWIRLSQAGTFVGVPGCVVDWSLTPGSITHTRQAEQRHRTAELLKVFQPSVLAEVNEDLVHEELARYASSAYGVERSLLLLRDLRNWAARGVKLPGQGAVLRELLQHPLASLGAGRRLAQEAKSRRRWRESKAHAGS